MRELLLLQTHRAPGELVLILFLSLGSKLAVPHQVWRRYCVVFSRLQRHVNGNIFEDGFM